jgi:hypothetical protein
VDGQRGGCTQAIGGRWKGTLWGWEREPERMENWQVLFSFPWGIACSQFQMGHVQGCA